MTATPKARVIALIPGVVDLAVEQFHADGDAEFRRERRNLGKAGDTVVDRRGVVDPRVAIAEHRDDVRHARARRERQHDFQFLQQQRVIGRVVESRLE